MEIFTKPTIVLVQNSLVVNTLWVSEVRNLANYLAELLVIMSLSLCIVEDPSKILIILQENNVGISNSDSMLVGVRSKR